MWVELTYDPTQLPLLSPPSCTLDSIRVSTHIYNDDARCYHLKILYSSRPSGLFQTSPKLSYLEKIVI